MSERNYTHNATWYDRDAREGVRVEGLSVRSPADWKPDFVEYELSINLEKFREWLSSKIASGGIDRNGWVHFEHWVKATQATKGVGGQFCRTGEKDREVPPANITMEVARGYAAEQCCANLLCSQHSGERLPPIKKAPTRGAMQGRSQS